MAPPTPVEGIPRVRLKYKCKVCHIHPLGSDLRKHYQTKTDWKLLEEMQDCVGDQDLVRLKKKADPHTIFMFLNNHSKTNMPKWETHTIWRGEADLLDFEKSDEQPLQKKPRTIASFFERLPKNHVPDCNMNDMGNSQGSEGDNSAQEPTRSRSRSQSREGNTGERVQSRSPDKSMSNSRSQSRTPSPRQSRSPSLSRTSSRSRSRGRCRSTSHERRPNRSRSRVSKGIGERGRPGGMASSRSRSNGEGRGEEKEEIQKLKLKLSDDEIDELAEKLMRKMDEKREQQEARSKPKAECWEEGSDFFVCKVCSNHSARSEVPSELSKSRKYKGNNFGVIAKRGNDGELRTGRDLRGVMKRHTDLNLHKWCCRKEDMEKRETKNFDETNTEVGKNLIRAFLKNARRGLGSADLQSDIDLLHLTPGVPKSNKNDSRSIFFELRDDCFEVVTDKIQGLFQSGNITECSVTLDKVTVQHKSFTVVLTFFFWKGKIYCVLNGLITMTKDDYNAQGTAEMLVRTLRETLGLNRTRLANILVHFR